MGCSQQEQGQQLVVQFSFASHALGLVNKSCEDENLFVLLCRIVGPENSSSIPTFKTGRVVALNSSFISVKFNFLSDGT